MEDQGSFGIHTAGTEVVLKVGGTLFTTSAATLTSGFAQGSWFGAMFSGQYADPVQGGHIFIDRDPKHFATVLSFLRDGWCAIPENLLELRQLRSEAEYYSLAGLLSLIDNSPTMIPFFKMVMAGSPEADALDILGTETELSIFWGYFETASEPERLAAQKRTRQLRDQKHAYLIGRLHDRQAPPVIQLLIPNDLPSTQALAGRYTLLEGLPGNGYPVWNHCDGHGWLFTDSNGYWAFSKIRVSSPNDFFTDMSYVRSAERHRGTNPIGITNWSHALNGEFELNDAISVTMDS